LPILPLSLSWRLMQVKAEIASIAECAGCDQIPMREGMRWYKPRGGVK
jgi:hypothetical protein